MSKTDNKTPILGKHISIPKFRGMIASLIEAKALAIIDVLHRCNYSSMNSYYNAVKGKGKNELSGLEVLAKLLREIGYEVEFTVKVIDKKKTIERRSINKRIVKKVQNRKRRQLLMEEYNKKLNEE